MKAKPPPSEEGKPPRRLCYVATDNCEFKRPLELFVFSTLARMSSGIRFNKLLGYVGCGKATLARTLKRLQFLGVAENVDNKWRAIEPPLDWFVAIKQKLPGWRNGLLYFDVPPVELPLTDALILGRIANLAATYKAAGTSISVAGLASSVKVSQRTAFRAIERLIEINLLDCVIHRGERGKRKQATISDVSIDLGSARSEYAWAGVAENDDEALAIATERIIDKLQLLGFRPRQFASSL